MDIFHLVKNHLAILGLTQIQSILSYVTLVGASVIITLDMILCCVYFLFVASSYEQYIDSFFNTSGSVVIFVIFFIYIWQKKQLFQYINLLQKIVNASKWCYGAIVELCWKCPIKIIWGEMWFLFRIRTSSIESNPRGNQPTSWKIEWNFILFLCEIVAGVFLLAKIYGQLFRLFFHRFGKWCSLIADSDVVRDCFIDMLKLVFN